MKIGILGSGTVATTLGTKLVALDHEVRVSSRRWDDGKGEAWAATCGPRATYGDFEDAAAFGEILFNCTAGSGSMEALERARAENLAGKILVDVANPLDFSHGAPGLFTTWEESLAERIQARFPGARVVKALNTVNAQVMVEPWRVEGEHTAFVAGNDPEARTWVADRLRDWFGWLQVLDLGDLTAARGLEAWVPLWVRIMGALGTPVFNISVIRGA